jgi:hypothetical protein
LGEGDRGEQRLLSLGVEKCRFKGVAGSVGAGVEVESGEGELEGFGSGGDDEGLAEVAQEGGVFAEEGFAVGDRGAATGIPVGEGGLAEVAVVDADEGWGVEGGFEEFVPLEVGGGRVVS